jgi:hypothetical protein
MVHQVYPIQGQVETTGFAHPAKVNLKTSQLSVINVKGTEAGINVANCEQD